MRQLVASIASKQNKKPLAHARFIHVSTFVHKSSFVMLMPQEGLRGCNQCSVGRHIFDEQVKICDAWSSP